MKFLTKFILNIILDYIPALLVMVAGALYAVYFPNYWGGLLLITIVAVFILSVKVFSKIQFESKRK